MVSDRIDLLEDLTKIWLIFVKNKYLIACCLIIGLAAGYVTHYVSNRERWSAEMMVSTNLLNKEESAFLIEQVNKRSIKEVNTDNLIYIISRSEFDPIVSHLFYIKITAVSTNRESFQVMQKQLTNYLNNCETVKRKQADLAIYYNDRIEKLDSERNALSLIQLEKIKNMSLEKRDSLLIEKRLQFEQSLRDLKSVHLVAGFAPIRAPYKLSVLLAIGGAFGIIISLMVIFIRFYIPYVKQYQIKNR